jgi:hypothetical protein
LNVKSNRLQDSTLAERRIRQFRIFGSETERRTAIQRAVNEYTGNALTFQRQGVGPVALADVNLGDAMLLDTTPAEQRMIRQAVEARSAKTFV